MYRLTLLPLFAILVLAACGGGTYEEPAAEEMAEETSAVVAELQASQELFHDMMEGLTEDQWRHQENDGRWSIAGVAEHLVISEVGLGGMVTDQVLATEASEPQAAPDSLDQMIMTMMTDRSQTFSAPESAQPTGAYATPAEAIAAFDEARAANIAAALENADRLRNHQMENPIGMVLDAEQWLIFLSAHTRRHLAQAQQVKDHEAYPAG